MGEWLLIDLDGVLRRWDAARDAEIEMLHGLPAGSIREAAFGVGSRLQDAVTGRIPDEEWRDHVAKRLHALGPGDAASAVAEWSRSPGTVDAEVLDVIRAARGSGWLVAVLTNATTRLAEDLQALGLDAEVDLVVNSADQKVAKPDPAFFTRACGRAGARRTDCVFVDDNLDNVDAARGVGLSAHLFAGPEALSELLGLPSGPAG